jgi:hypothetical protein
MFANLRTSWRLRRARKLIDVGQFDAAQALLIGILEKPPKDGKLLQIYAALAETELGRCHFLNSRYYARLFFEGYQALPGDVAGSSEYQSLHHRVSWCDEESQNPTAPNDDKVIAPVRP